MEGNLNSYEKINKDNKEHINFISKLNSSEAIKKYIGFLNINFESLSDSFFFKNNNNYVGYISFSKPVKTKNGISRSLYYAISEEYRKNGYAIQMLKDICQVLESSVDFFVLNINKNNIGSIKVATNAGFSISFEDDEDYLFTYKLKN